jgi:hypothetical protein
MSFILLYILALVLTCYSVCSVFVSCELNYEPPIFPNLIDLKNTVTLRTILIGILIGAIPFINFGIAIFGMVIVMINLIIVLCKFLFKSEKLDIKPFNRTK